MAVPKQDALQTECKCKKAGLTCTDLYANALNQMVLARIQILLKTSKMKMMTSAALKMRMMNSSEDEDNNI